jgi:hypothetical protein
MRTRDQVADWAAKSSRYVDRYEHPFDSHQVIRVPPAYRATEDVFPDDSATLCDEPRMSRKREIPMVQETRERPSERGTMERSSERESRGHGTERGRSHSRTRSYAEHAPDPRSRSHGPALRPPSVLRTIPPPQPMYYASPASVYSTHSRVPEPLHPPPARTSQYMSEAGRRRRVSDPKHDMLRERPRSKMIYPPVDVRSPPSNAREIHIHGTTFKVYHPDGRVQTVVSTLFLSCHSSSNVFARHPAAFVNLHPSSSLAVIIRSNARTLRRHALLDHTLGPEVEHAKVPPTLLCGVLSTSRLSPPHHLRRKRNARCSSAYFRR